MRFVFYSAIAVGSFIGLMVLLTAWVFLSTPRPTDIRSCLVTKMYQVHLCPTDAGYTRIRDISAPVKYAVIVSEDASFYDHHGIDWFELRESFETNLEEGRFVRGGSTITQQLAKNVYLTPEKALLRKVREAIIAVQLEKVLKKDEILEKYFNVVEFGPGIYGVAQAAEYYFHKRPATLSVAEGAWLAFLLPNPKKYSQSFKAGGLTAFANRQTHEIVRRLLRFGKIQPAEAEAAGRELDKMFRKGDQSPLTDGATQTRGAKDSNWDSVPLEELHSEEAD